MLCRHCGGSLPCKPCTAARVQRWADEHRERARAHKQRYIELHPEKAKAAKREWYERNRANEIRKASEQKKADPERTRKLYRDQYAKDRTPFLIRENRRQERERVAGGKFTRKEECAMFAAQSGICANPYCQADLSITGFHADHKRPVLMGGTHDAENRQLLCPTCNHRKGTMSNEAWLAQQKELSA